MNEQPEFTLGIRGYAAPVEIGRGGFGVVYRAQQVELHREVAIKVLRGTALDDRSRLRFDRERTVMGSLSSHPSIVTIFDSGFTELGSPFLAMELMDGGSLADRLDGEGPLEWQEVAEVGIRIAGALEAAHRVGVLHRDVKPDNVLMSSYGEVKLTDFGIASMIEGTVTATGNITASVVHAAPEVLEGRPASVASDVYSLGSSLFSLLVGQPAFLRPTDEGVVQLITRILTKPVPDMRPGGVPGAVADVIEQAMAKEPSRRYTSAEAFGRALADAGAGAGAAVSASLMAIRDGSPRRSRAEATALGLRDEPTPDTVLTPSSTPPTFTPPSLTPGSSGVTPSPSPSFTPPSFTPPGLSGITPSPSPSPSPSPKRRRRVLVGAAAAVVIIGLTGIALALSGGGDEVVVTGETDPTGAAQADGSTTTPTQPAASSPDVSGSTTSTSSAASPTRSGGSATRGTTIETDTAGIAGLPTTTPVPTPTTAPRTTTTATTAPVTTAPATTTTLPAEVGIPAVTGQDLASATRTLNQAGLSNVTSTVDCFGSPDRGKVFSQDPAPGFVVARESVVHLKVEDSSCAFVPSVVGSDLDTALATLGSANFAYQWSSACLGGPVPNAVVSQTPAGGADVKASTVLVLRIQADGCQSAP